MDTRTIQEGGNGMMMKMKYWDLLSEMELGSSYSAFDLKCTLQDLRLLERCGYIKEIAKSNKKNAACRFKLLEERS
jgi:hypothetical protein